MSKKSPVKHTFTSYQIFLIAVLAFLQFTVILDFMVLSPLGVILIDEMDISPAQFGWVVSAYAFSAGISGLLSAGFADKFDRKKLLLFFYGGFIIGTFFCGLAPNYTLLLFARIITGIFGGVMTSISYAIITDLFAFETRGRVMGFVQMAFAASRILGIPVGLYLAANIGWHSPFVIIASIATLVFIIISLYMKPVDGHLKFGAARQNALGHLLKTITNKDYLRGFGVTIFLATGGFMLMPLGSKFSVENLGISIDDLPVVYLVSGLFTFFVGPLAGRISDSIGKYQVFWIGSVLTIVLVTIYCNLGITPLWLVILINVLLFTGITARMVASQALITAVPEARDRGAFMSINSSIQQLSGGIASALAGIIVIEMDSGKLQHYDMLGNVVSITMIITIILMYFVNKMIMTRKHEVSGAVEKTE